MKRAANVAMRVVLVVVCKEGRRIFGERRGRGSRREREGGNFGKKLGEGRGQNRTDDSVQCATRAAAGGGRGRQIGG